MPVEEPCSVWQRSVDHGRRRRDFVVGVNLQDGKLSGRGDEDWRRQQREADDEENCGCDVEAAKDEKTVPPTDCWASATLLQSGYASLKQSSRRSPRNAGSCRSHALKVRPTQELKVHHAAAFAACAGVVSHTEHWSCRQKKRLTREPAFFLLSSGRGGKRSSGTFVSWQPDIATIREGVE